MLEAVGAQREMRGLNQLLKRPLAQLGTGLEINLLACLILAVSLLNQPHKQLKLRLFPLLGLQVLLQEPLLAAQVTPGAASRGAPLQRER